MIVSSYLPEQLNTLIALIIILAIPVWRRTFFGRNNTAPERTNERRESLFDVMRGIAILAVIVIHVIYFYLREDPTAYRSWLDPINNVLRFAIPWFLITSGVLLPSGLASTKEVLAFFKRRFAALYIPYIVLTAVIVAGYGLPLSAFPQFLATGNALVPYYFLIVLAQCYLLYPFLVKVKNSPWAFTGLFLFSLVCFLLTDTWHIGNIPFVGQYIFFFFYGIYKRNELLQTETRPRGTKHWLGIMMTAAIIFLAFRTFQYNVSLFYAIPFFYIFYAIHERLKRTAGLYRTLAHIGQNSLWIFLLHFPCIGLAYLLLANLPLPAPIVFILISTLAILMSIPVAALARALYAYICQSFALLFSIRNGQH